jgi:hypothetical protein
LPVKKLQSLCFRIWSYEEQDIETYQHAHELPTRLYNTVNIDLNIKTVLSLYWDYAQLKSGLTSTKLYMKQQLHLVIPNNDGLVILGK